MRNFVVCFVLCLVCASFSAQAKPIHENLYTEPNLADLTKFAAHFPLVNISDPETFTEYLNLTDCKLFDSVKDNPFKQQSLQAAAVNALGSEQKNDKPIYFRIPITLMVLGYNFETQSLPIVPESQFKKVNILELIPPSLPLCARGNTGAMVHIPTYYAAKLNSSISLYRIPVEKNIAESIMSKTDHQDDNVHYLYGYILLEIEHLSPEILAESNLRKTIVRGQVNAIDLYIDQNRKILFKRLDYSENH